MALRFILPRIFRARQLFIYFYLKNTPFLEQNAEEMKQDIIVVKLNISKLNKAVFQWTLQ